SRSLVMPQYRLPSRHSIRYSTQPVDMSAQCVCRALPGGAFGAAIIATHVEFTADQRPAFVDAATHVLAVECGAPAVIGLAHYLHAVLVLVDVLLGRVVAGDQQHLQAATDGGAAAAMDAGVDHRAIVPA